MRPKILLVTPPFTQLNTAYPATAYLKGFLEKHEVPCPQLDLSIELFTSIFSSSFLQKIFKEAQDQGNFDFPQIRKNRKKYIHCIDEVIAFLQKQDVTLAHKILEPDFLPIGHRLSKVNKNIKWEKG